MESPNFYAIIPATVRYCEDLIPTAKLLYGEITALSNERGYCWASNSHFARLYNVSDFTVSRWISQLESKGFIRTQVDKSAGNQRLIYINDSVPLLRKSARGIDEKRKTLLRKSARPIDEKRNHNNTVNIKDNTTSSSGGARENQLDFEKEKKEKAPPIPARPPTVPTPPTPPARPEPAPKPVPTATTFAESIWHNSTTGAFAQALHQYAPETVDADADYYRGRCRDWSAQHPACTKPDWLAFAAQIISDDRRKQKLVTLQSSPSHASNTNNSSAGPSVQPLLDRDNLVERAGILAARFRSKQQSRNQQ